MFFVYVHILIFKLKGVVHKRCRIFFCRFWYPVPHVGILTLILVGQGRGGGAKVPPVPLLRRALEGPHNFPGYPTLIKNCNFSQSRKAKQWKEIRQFFEQNWFCLHIDTLKTDDTTIFTTFLAKNFAFYTRRHQKTEN